MQNVFQILLSSLDVDVEGTGSSHGNVPRSKSSSVTYVSSIFALIKEITRVALDFVWLSDCLNLVRAFVCSKRHQTYQLQVSSNLSVIINLLPA